jgi:hypothetical protein
MLVVAAEDPTALQVQPEVELEVSVAEVLGAQSPWLPQRQTTAQPIRVAAVVVVVVQ